MNSMVFLHPSSIEFTSRDLSQAVSIFNPYDSPIYFSFKCTRPLAFQISTSEGEILAKHSLDIVINLLDKTITEEQFQIRIYGASKVKKLAEKILKVTMKQTNEETEKSNVAQKDAFKAEHFQDLAQPSYSNRTNNMEHRLPNQYFIYSALGICFALLLFPHEDQPESTFRMLQVSVNLKLVAAYILGIVTVFLIRN